MTCPNCGSPNGNDAQFCQGCGQRLGQTRDLSRRAQSAPSGAPDLHLDHTNQGTIRVGDVAITVEGDLVPVANVELGGVGSIYFEHYILLWKQPDVSIRVRTRSGMARRFFAGLPIFISEARGPGNVAVSRESVGQIVALPLSPGQSIDVREHQFLLATSSVEYGYISVSGVAAALFGRAGSRTGLFLDRFTSRGESGLVLLHGYGNVFETMLAPGEVLDVDPGAWLWKDTSVQMTVTSLVGSGHGGLMGALGNMMSGVSISLNRFTGPGRIGIQSMTYMPTEHRESGEAEATSGSFFGAAGSFMGGS